MTLVELSTFKYLSFSTYSSPFVVRCVLGGYNLPSYWTVTFGAPDESFNEIIFVDDVVGGSLVSYSKVSTLADCIAEEKSWYWNSSDQAIYVHLDHSVYESLETDYAEYGQVFGMSDSRPVYVDGVLYLPIVTSAPAIEQQQDLASYSKLAFLTGTIGLNNAGGLLDFLINNPVYGNVVRILDLDDEPDVDDYSRSDLQTLATFYVEDYDQSLKAVNFQVQDLRKRDSAQVPSLLFSRDDYPDLEDSYVGKGVPLAYGTIAVCKAIPLNGQATGDVTFRIALTYTSLGTVQVKSNDRWTTVVPSSSDAAGGTFVLAAADARTASDGVLECRVLSMVGIAVTYASDVIVDMNDRYLSIPFDGSNYDLTEWGSEETALSPIGILFDTQLDLYDAFQKVQSGANVGFRYEINADGLRTIRVDDWNRDPVGYVQQAEVLNADELPGKSDSAILAGSVTVSYARNFYDDTADYLSDDSNLGNVEHTYRQNPTLNVETYLTTAADAQLRADFAIQHYGKIPVIFTLKIAGSRWKSLRIYDLFFTALAEGRADIDSLEIDGRKFYGFAKLSVLSVAPDRAADMNTVTAVLVGLYNTDGLGTEDGFILATEDGAAILLEEEAA